MTMTLEPAVKRFYLILAAIGVAVIAAFVVAQTTGEGSAAPQTLKVNIRGNLGGNVMVDGNPTLSLRAYDGTDVATVTAKQSVIVTVTSTGDAPWCHVEDEAGVMLADQTGSAPQAPVSQTATCNAQLAK